MTPDYRGAGLVNLLAELERNLTGSAPAPPLAHLEVAPAEGYVLVLFDGLGSHQLEEAGAAGLLSSRTGEMTAGFPTTTTTSLATIVTGLPPVAHGVIGHVLHLRGIAPAVNVLKWTTPSGQPVDHDYDSFLPAPNLWERVSAAGIEPITVQPGPFLGSPLSRMLYRGCRFEPAWSAGELVDATVDVAGAGRLVLTYFPNVDVAAHVEGRDSEAYAEAVAQASQIWEQLSLRLPRAVGLVGTADHGHVDYRPADKILIRDRRYDPLLFFGDPRSVYVTGPSELIDDLAASTGADSVSREELVVLLGAEPLHPDLPARLPDRLLLAPRGRVLLPRPFDKRLIGYHGGLEGEELLVPLLTRP
ncbi:MAG: alkaline phosphatase family protein [Actinomycetota bacterium]